MAKLEIKLVRSTIRGMVNSIDFMLEVKEVE